MEKILLRVYLSFVGAAAGCNERLKNGDSNDFPIPYFAPALAPKNCPLNRNDFAMNALSYSFSEVTFKLLNGIATKIGSIKCDAKFIVRDSVV